MKDFEYTNLRTLTVAIPTYDREDYMFDCLKSLSLQIFKDFKVIIFDNASNYSVENFISIFSDLNIEIIKSFMNIGNQANFAKIISYKFTSPYVIMLHDDDTLHPLYFEKVISFLNSHRNVVWVGSSIKFIHSETNMAMSFFDKKVPEKSFIEIDCDDVVRRLMLGLNLGFGSVVYRSEVLEKAIPRIKEFDKWFDRPLLIDLVNDGTVGISYGQYMNYRVHRKQDSQTKDMSKINNLVKLFFYFKDKSRGINKMLFKKWAADNSISAAVQFASDINEFRNNLKIFRDCGLFRLRYVSIKGIYYLSKFFTKKVL